MLLFLVLSIFSGRVGSQSTITTRYGCNCQTDWTDSGGVSHERCTVGGWNGLPWCKVEEGCVNYEEAQDLCVDSCKDKSEDDWCVVLLSSGESTSGIRNGQDGHCAYINHELKCVRQSGVCEAGRLRLFESAETSCHGMTSLSSTQLCTCLLNLPISHRDKLSCKLSSSQNELLFQTFTQCWNTYSDRLSTTTESVGQRNNHPTTRPPHGEPEQDDENAHWAVFLLIVLFAFFIILGIAFWIWKCRIMDQQDQQHGAQLQSLNQEINQLKDSLRTVHANMALSQSQSLSYQGHQPGSPMKQGEPTHISTERTHSHYQPPSQTYSISQSADHGSMQKQSQIQYEDPPQPVWSDENQIFIDANADMGPTPIAPSIINNNVGEKFDVTEIKITAGNEAYQGEML